MEISTGGERTILARAPVRDLNQEFHILIGLICEAIPEFRHYDPRKIAVSINRSRSRGKNGVWAFVVPLRYKGGAAQRRGVRRGIPGVFSYESPKIIQQAPDALYLMSFLFPRFFYLRPRERLETIVHELYHLHPTMRGDLRTFPGKHIHHGPTPALFKKRVSGMTSVALSQFPTLQEHPLIKGDGAEYADARKLHYPIPKRVFRWAAPQKVTGTFLRNDASFASRLGTALSKLFR
jgi:hypothetical protein